VSLVRILYFSRLSYGHFSFQYPKACGRIDSVPVLIGSDMQLFCEAFRMCCTLKFRIRQM